MGVLIPLLVFLIVAAAVLALSSIVMRKQVKIAARLTALEQSEETLFSRDKKLSLPLYNRVVVPVYGRIVNLMDRLTPAHTKDMIDNSLRNAGLQGKVSTGTFLGVVGIAIIVVPGTVFILTSLAGMPGMSVFQLTFVAFAVALLAPLLYLYALIQKRKEMILRQLPDLLDLMVVSVEAGYGFDAALSYVTQKMDGPLPEEFEKALRKIRMGQLRREVFREMAEQTDVSEVANFVSAISQADQLGVSIGNVLRVQSDQMRVARRQRAEQAAMKAPIKIVFPLVLFIFPTLFIVILGPVLITIFETLL